MSGKPGQIAGKWLMHYPTFNPPLIAYKIMTATPGKLSYWVQRAPKA